MKMKFKEEDVIGVIILVVVVGLTMFFISKNNTRYYADLMKVVEIEYNAETETNLVTFETETDYFKYITNSNDIEVGDFYNALMIDAGEKNNVQDDKIIDIRYERIDLMY